MPHVVEERAVLRARQGRRHVRDPLHDAFQIQIAGNRRCQAVECLEPLCLLPQRRFGDLPRRDVARDFRGADNDAFCIPHRRDRQRNVDQRAVLAPPHGFIVIDAFTASDAPKDRRFLLLQVRRDQDGDGLADDLVGGVAEHALGALVPAVDDAIKVLADDRIV